METYIKSNNNSLAVIECSASSANHSDHAVHRRDISDADIF
jgi:hypothetical protein